MDVHLAWDPFVTFKKKAVQKMYFMTLPVLSIRSLSIGFRVRMFHTFIIGTLNFGIELLHGSIKKVQSLQLLINKALRAVLNCNRSTSIVAMSLEAGTQLVATRATGSAIRLLNKAASLKTTIHQLSAPILAGRPLSELNRKKTSMTSTFQSRQRLMVEEVASGTATLGRVVHTDCVIKSY
jgi:hypothetical protein